MFGNWCKPGERPTPFNPCVFGPGGIPSGGLFPFNNAVQPFIGPTPTPEPATPVTPVFPSCFDTMTAVSFSVPVSNTIPVSGGGAALALAIVGSGPGDRFLITDSLDYSPITLSGKTDITIEADAGQTPTITANAGDALHCVTLANGNNGVALLGLTFVGSGNAGAPPAPGAATQGLVNYNNAAGGLRRLIIEDCTFVEPDGTVTSGAPGIWLRGTNGSPNHENVSVHRCTFVNTAMSLTAIDASGAGACTIGGFSDVFIQNCWIRRTTNVISRSQSPMRGVVIKVGNGVVEDVFCDDIGTGGECQNFCVPTGTAFGNVNGTMTFRNCVSLNGRFGYATLVAGPTMIVQNCVYYANQINITATAVFLNTIGTLSFLDSVAYGAGDGFAFTPDPLGTPIVENHSDVFNFGTNGRTLDPSDIQVNPAFQGYTNGDFVATAAAARVASSSGGPIGVVYPGGEKIIWCQS